MEDKRLLKNIPSGHGIPNGSQRRRPIVLRPHYVDGEDIFVVDWPGRPQGPVPAFLKYEEAKQYADTLTPVLWEQALAANHEEALKLDAIREQQRSDEQQAQQ